MAKHTGKGYLPAAEAVLKSSGKPMRCADIVAIAMEKGWLKSNGKTPNNTMNALLRRHIEKNGEEGRFYSPEKGVYGLR